MKQTATTKNARELHQLCTSVRALVTDENYEACTELVLRAMGQYPHAPQPHNLLGIVLERMGDHNCAMRHFRAAWALDPSYLPANYNLNAYGTFFSTGICAFDESDIPATPHKRY